MAKMNRIERSPEDSKLQRSLELRFIVSEECYAGNSHRQTNFYRFGGATNCFLAPGRRRVAGIELFLGLIPRAIARGHPGMRAAFQWVLPRAGMRQGRSVGGHQYRKSRQSKSAVYPRLFAYGEVGV